MRTEQEVIDKLGQTEQATLNAPEAEQDVLAASVVTLRWCLGLPPVIEEPTINTRLNFSDIGQVSALPEKPAHPK